MTITPNFYVNLWGDLQGNLNSAAWGASMDAWNARNYQDSFFKLLDYINPSLRIKYGNATQTTFDVPHGSVVVSIAVKNNNVEISCPFVDITDAVRVPLLRKVAELNFSPLGLAQINLSANKLSFSYSASLDTCEPYKMYYVLKEICQTADHYDDEFKEKFKAKNLIEPKVIYPSADIIDKAWKQTNEIINETFQYLAYFDTQRWHGSSLDFLVMALKRIQLCIQVQGFLKGEVERVNNLLMDRNTGVNDRVQTGSKFLKQIQESGKEVFSKNLYQAEIFIPEKWRTNGEQIKNQIKDALAQTEKHHTDKNYIASCIESLYVIYDLFFKNNMDHAVNAILIGTLTSAAGKSWQDSSAILLGGLQTLNNTKFN